MMIMIIILMTCTCPPNGNSGLPHKDPSSIGKTWFGRNMTFIIGA